MKQRNTRRKLGYEITHNFYVWKGIWELTKISVQAVKHSQWSEAQAFKYTWWSVLRVSVDIIVCLQHMNKIPGLYKASHKSHHLCAMTIQPASFQ